jgi:hypothetical protein
MKKEKNDPAQEETKFDFRTIKTFADACHKIRVTTALPTLVNGCQELLNASNAAYKLMVIFQAINDGWRPDWANTDQAKWFPWHGVLPSGSGFSGSGSGYLCGRTIVGSRLCTDSVEKSDYIAEQFEAEYRAFKLYN